MELTRPPARSPTPPVRRAPATNVDALPPDAPPPDADAGLPPDVGVSVTMLVCASVMLLTALYHSLPLPALTFVPAVASAVVCTATMRGVRALKGVAPVGRGVRVGLLVSMRMLLTTMLLACIAACAAHFFCFYRLVAAASADDSEADGVCSTPVVDGAMSPLGAACTAYVALVTLDVATTPYVYT